MHGLAVDRDRRVYVGDRSNDRIQIFTEDGEFIEEWPDVSDPVGVFIDENDAVWVISAMLNRILKYDRDGRLLYHWGVYGGTRGGFPGGLSRPHQLDVDQGRQRVYRELGRRMDEQVRSQAERRPREADWQGTRPHELGLFRSAPTRSDSKDQV